MKPTANRNPGDRLLPLIAIAALTSLVAAALWAPPPAAAQDSQLGLPEAPRNLQVLPADMSTREVVGMMRGFAGGLGVRCNYCHVGDNPRDLDSTDFASDDKPAKQKARVMMRMVQEINQTHVAQLAELGSDSASLLRVNCSTCHHGQARPRTLQQVLEEAAGKGGAVMAIAEYERLRERYYGGWTYDFSEGALLATAEQLASGGDVDGGIALVDKNLELFPESAFSFITRAQIQMRAGDAEGARASLDSCIETLAEPGFCEQALARFQQQQ